jgi:hypothetical protein
LCGAWSALAFPRLALSQLAANPAALLHTASPPADVSAPRPTIFWCPALSASTRLCCPPAAGVVCETRRGGGQRRARGPAGAGVQPRRGCARGRRLLAALAAGGGDDQ